MVFGKGEFEPAICLFAAESLQARAEDDGDGADLDCVEQAGIHELAGQVAAAKQPDAAGGSTCTKIGKHFGWRASHGFGVFGQVLERT
jgi:hypothetical protein